MGGLLLVGGVLWEGPRKVCSPVGRQEGPGVAAQRGPPILARWAGGDEVMIRGEAGLQS